MVNNKDTKVSYKGNGQTTVFPFSFPFIKGEYIHVAIYDSLTDSTVTLTKDYYVDTVAKTVNYPGYPPGQEPAEALRPPVLPATSTITIYRETDIDQLTDLGEKYPLPQIEAMSDKLTEILQEQQETLGRAVKVPVGDPKTPEERWTDMQDFVHAAADSANNAATSEASAQRAAEAAATSEANAAESERLASGYADTATAAAGRAEDSAISARAYNAPDYDNETTYQAGDVVTYTDGNSYRALQETTGNEPPNIIYWQKVTDYVGDDFFQIDEYGYIVPMDSPSHSRYWRVDQNGYIVPIEGGDGGYRPDTRYLSSEYLNVTNEGYVKHFSADDVVTGNTTTTLLTANQANVTSLTANAVNAGTVTANSASVTEISAGTLTADDIIAKGPVVDVRAFGAKGDGVTDDTVAIQSAIDYARNIFLTTATCPIVIMPKGTYKITETVVMPRYVNIKSVGSVLIHNYVNNAAALHIVGKQNGDIDIATHYSKLNRLRGSLIDGDNGGIHIIGKTNTAIGLELGSSSNPDDVWATVAGSSIKNLGITKCDVGIKFNSWNVYIDSFYDCHIEDNNINIQFGNTGDNLSNSGENISFYFCNISSAPIGVKFNVASFDTNFFGCSFDYNTITFSVLHNFHNINIYGGHVESTNKIIHSEGTGNESIFAYINGTVIVCDNVPLYDGEFQLKTDSVVLERHSLTKGYTSFMYLATDDVLAEEKSTRIRGGGSGSDYSFENIYLPLSAKNNKIGNSKFNDITFPTYGSITHTTSEIANGTTITLDGITLTAGTDFNALPTDSLTATQIVNALNNKSEFNSKFVASNMENVITVRSKDRTGANTPTTMTVSGTYGKVTNGQLIPGGLNYVDIAATYYQKYFRACSGYGGVRTGNATCKLTNSFPSGSNYTCAMEVSATGANGYVRLDSKQINCTSGTDLICGAVIYAGSQVTVSFSVSYYDIEANPLSTNNTIYPVIENITYGRWNTYMVQKYNHNIIPTGAAYMTVGVTVANLQSGQTIYIGDIYVDMQ